MSVPVEMITRERLGRWASQLDRNHATPLALFGVGHDQAKGALVICTVDEKEMDTVTLRRLLRAALYQLGD
jgi:hypothetical protein